MHTARFGRAGQGLARLLCLLFFSLVYSTASNAQLNPGDVLVADPGFGTQPGDTSNLGGALFKVNPTTGQRTLISDFGNPNQGPLSFGPIEVAIENPDSILVIDPGGGQLPGGTLFRVDPATGQRTVVSDFTDPNQGPLSFAELSDVAVTSSGTILVLDASGGSGNGLGALLTVDPATGERTTLSDFGDPNQGPLGWDPTGLALADSSTALVVDPRFGTNFDGGLFRVNLSTGQRTLISDFGNPDQGVSGRGPVSVAIDDSGRIFVLSPFAGTNALGALVRVDATTGERTLISDFGDPNKGVLGFDPNHLAIDDSGDILVTNLVDDVTPGRVLFRVDPNTGQRTVLSDFEDPSQGPLGRAPRGIAVVPALLTCNGLPATITGTPGDDTLPGTNGDDVIHGLGGNDVISAGNGKDIVCGGEGNDVINGGNGADQLFGEAGNDALKGNNGRDELFGGEGGDDLDGGNGKDVLAGEEGDDLLSGGRGKDSLDGGPDNDECDGDRGKDTAQNCETMTSVP